MSPDDLLIRENNNSIAQFEHKFSDTTAFFGSILKYPYLVNSAYDHVSSAIKTPQNLLVEFWLNTQFSHYLHMPPLTQEHQGLGRHHLPELLHSCWFPSHCPSIQITAHLAFSIKTNLHHITSLLPLLLSFQLLTLKVQSESMWFKMTLLHLPLPSLAGLLYCSSEYKTSKHDFALSPHSKGQATSCLSL